MMEDNLIDIVNKSIEYLKKNKINNPRLIVESIITDVLKINKLDIYTNYDRKLNDLEKNEIRKKLKEYNGENLEIKPNTVKEYFEKTKIYLDKKGIPESNMITNIIFSKVLDTDMSLLFTKYSSIVNEEAKEKIKSILKKLVELRLPIQYIFNEQIFYGHTFYVDKNVLIPRLDTETIVEKALELILRKNNPIVLDIGTGSGAIGITIAIENSESKVLATDISENALTVSKKNAQILDVKNIKFLKSNLFENIEYRNFDLIVSNPPYISNGEQEYMSLDTVHEPELALFAENEGLYFYYEIASEAINYLNNEGYLLFEIGFKQGLKVKEIMENYGFKDVNIGKDLTGNDRYVYGIKKGN